ncbi:MAG: DUF2271 domain-containing protein [Planctomycetes bacterium]|nr:DUF2271 domain-containing protein [Planctomycetota bacterium]MCC7396025.1 DUF2271 domain-containing protein [Planctomycetota bacterium]
MVWDGTDDDGRRLVAGRYVVCIEIVREHGAYEFVRKEIDLLQQPVQLDIAGSEELASARLVFAADAAKGGGR